MNDRPLFLPGETIRSNTVMGVIEFAWVDHEGQWEYTLVDTDSPETKHSKIIQREVLEVYRNGKWFGP